MVSCAPSAADLEVAPVTPAKADVTAMAGRPACLGALSSDAATVVKIVVERDDRGGLQAGEARFQLTRSPLSIRVDRFQFTPEILTYHAPRPFGFVVDYRVLAAAPSYESCHESGDARSWVSLTPSDRDEWTSLTIDLGRGVYGGTPLGLLEGPETHVFPQEAEPRPNPNTYELRIRPVYPQPGTAVFQAQASALYLGSRLPRTEPHCLARLPEEWTDPLYSGENYDLVLQTRQEALLPSHEEVRLPLLPDDNRRWRVSGDNRFVSISDASSIPMPPMLVAYRIYRLQGASQLPCGDEDLYGWTEWMWLTPKDPNHRWTTFEIYPSLRQFGGLVHVPKPNLLQTILAENERHGFPDEMVDALEQQYPIQFRIVATDEDVRHQDGEWSIASIWARWIPGIGKNLPW